MPLMRCRADASLLHFPANYIAVLPESFRSGRKYPVVMLLHDLGSGAETMAQQLNLQQLADEAQVLLVLPDGRRSCFVDAAHGPKWNRYIAMELLRQVCSAFPALNDRAALIALGHSASALKGNAARSLFSVRAAIGPVWDGEKRCERSWPREAEWSGVFGIPETSADDPALILISDTGTQTLQGQLLTAILTCCSKMGVLMNQ